MDSDCNYCVSIPYFGAFFLALTLDAGVRSGWLINPQDQQVEIYRLGKEVEVRNLPTELSGEEVLPGFTLRLNQY